MVCLLVQTVRAADAVAAAAEEPKAKIVFSPEVEKKAGDFFAKVKEIMGKRARQRMQKEIEEVRKATGLSAEAAQALEKPAEQAADLAIEQSFAKAEEQTRQQFMQGEEQLLEMLEQMVPQLEKLADQEMMPDDSAPNEMPVWVEALRRTLSPEQAAAWAKTQAARKQTLDAEIGGFLKEAAERAREQQEIAILAKSADIKSGLQLSEERAKSLDALAKTAAEKSMEGWKVRAEKTLLAMPDAQRRSVVKNGHFFIAPDDAEAPEKQAVWKKGLAKLLTSEELQRMEGAREQKKTRRIRVMGQMLLMLFDEKVAFTESQREKLTPLAERIVKSQPALFPAGGPEDYFSFNPQMLFAAGSQAKAEELDAVLDPIQRKRWTEAINTRSQSSRRVVVQGRQAQAAAKPAAVTPEPEPEHFEHVLSDFLHEKSEAERKRVIAFMSLKAEDAARVAALPPAATARLLTAARGAAEEALAAWKTATGEMARGMVAEATPRNVKQVLDSLEDYQFRRGPDVAAEKRPIWEETAKTELTEEQRAAWKKETDAREAFRERAIAAVILSEFDRKASLVAEQWEKLEPVLVKFLREYGPDIAGMFSSSNTTPWFMQSYSMFIPFAGIPEAELRSVLGKEQWERWTGGDLAGNSTSYWESISRNREQRLKNQKK